MTRVPLRLHLSDGWLDLHPPRVMGVLNLTPDSFSDGGRFLAPEAALAHALDMVAQGADLIDIGGESTRPGSLPVGEDEQVARVVPVIRALRERSAVPVSIDTTRARGAAKALDAGADIVNDISAGRDDPTMLPLVAERRVPVVLMHMRGKPRTMQKAVHYPNDDVLAEVRDFLAERADAARSAGVEAERIVLDPGIGFGKTVAHNTRLIRGLSELTLLGYPVLLGASRKSFLGHLTDRPVEEREAGSLAAVTAGVLQGATLLRVHDVAATRDAVQVAVAIRDAGAPAGEAQVRA